MATTTQVTVTKDWVKLSDGNCTIQAIHNSNQFHISVDASPSDASILLRLNEPVTFDYDTPVWCKVPAGEDERKRKVTVIK